MHISAKKIILDQIKNGNLLAFDQDADASVNHIIDDRFSLVLMSSMDSSDEYINTLGSLDEANGRNGVTPEYPKGTYYYIITEDFPSIPRYFRGNPSDDFKIGN